MLKWTKEFKALNIEAQMEGETRPRKLYATPSKPFSMRQRDAKTAQILDGLIIIAGDKSDHLNAEISRGKIFYDRTPLIERDSATEEPVYKNGKPHRKVPRSHQGTLGGKSCGSQERQGTRRETREEPGGMSKICLLKVLKGSQVLDTAS